MNECTIGGDGFAIVARKVVYAWWNLLMLWESGLVTGDCLHIANR